jgi:cardiolipin synthase
VQVFDDGIETFEAIFKAVEKAKIFVRLQFNIFEKGKISQRF